MIPAPFPGGPAQASEPEPGLWFNAHRRSFPLHGHEPTYPILPDSLKGGLGNERPFSAILSIPGLASGA